MILPPFPFPNKWEDIAKLQATTNEFNWLVPSYYYYYYDNTNPDSDDAKNLSVEGGGVEEYELELNEEWAARLAGTVERLKQKSKVAKVTRKPRKHKRQKRSKNNNNTQTASPSTSH